MGLEVRRRNMGLGPDAAELAHDDGKPIGHGHAGLDAEELDVAAVEDVVVRRRRLIDEERPYFGQGTRIFKKKRVRHRRDKLSEAAVTLEKVVPVGIEPVLAYPRKAAADVAALIPEGMARRSGRIIVGHAAVVLLNGASRTGRRRHGQEGSAVRKLGADYSGKG